MRQVDQTHLSNFNPRPPRGGRRGGTLLTDTLVVFQSTPSARRATDSTPEVFGAGLYFNPRPPRGGRPMSCFASIST